jgi:hypothetical protein
MDFITNSAEISARGDETSHTFSHFIRRYVLIVLRRNIFFSSNFKDTLHLITYLGKCVPARVGNPRSPPPTHTHTPMSRSMQHFCVIFPERGVGNLQRPINFVYYSFYSMLSWLERAFCVTVQHHRACVPTESDCKRLYTPLYGAMEKKSLTLLPTKHLICRNCWYNGNFGKELMSFQWTVQLLMKFWALSKVLSCERNVTLSNFWAVIEVLSINCWACNEFLTRQWDVELSMNCWAVGEFLSCQWGVVN